ncbi:MAG: hypothetical protein Q7J82_00450 [Coriobacteriia bacterium]|nr:hypothetical protein [Coriobacteriia bacterium]
MSGPLVAEGGVTTAPVVEALDVVEDRGPRLRVVREPAALGQLGLDDGHEALGGGVVIGVAPRSHRRGDVEVLELLGEGERGVLGEFKGSLQHIDNEELRWD